MKKQVFSLISSRITVLFIVLAMFISCEKDQETLPELEYLIEYEKKYTLEADFIINLFNNVVDEYPEATELINSTEYDVDVYRISYKTTYRSEEIDASGLICMPLADNGFPILSFQNGTNTSHANAPSVNLSNPVFMLLQGLAGNGYIILIPDYLGFGASEEVLHPYYVKTTTNDAVIDMMYAAREFVLNYSDGASYNEHNFLMGYSQGGWATLAALEEIEANHANDFEIDATSCGAGAYDLMEVADYIIQLDTFPSPLYLPYYVYSHHLYGLITDPMNSYFQEPYASAIPELFSGSYSNGHINSQLTRIVPDLLVPGLIEGLLTHQNYEEIRFALAASSVEPWIANSPLHFYHGTNDLNVPPSESLHIYNGFVDLGLHSSVEHIVMEGKNHDTGVLPWGLNTLIWFNEIKSEY